MPKARKAVADPARLHARRPGMRARARWHRSATLLLVALSMVLVQPPSAVADEPVVSVRLVGAVLAGTKERPRIELTARRALARTELELTREDGTVLRRSGRALGAGERFTFPIEHPQGAWRWTGRLIVHPARGEALEFPLEMETALLPAPRIEVRKEDVDLQNRRLTLRLDRPPAEIRLTVTSDAGRVLAEVVRPFEDGANEVTVGWDQEPAVVLRMDVRATDRHGFYRDIELYPWRVDIPHEEVLFETGRHDILPEERPKLEAAWEELRLALQRYGKVAKVQLFVAGHTDTVGPAAGNQALSEARARAIARWFRQRGVTVPIHFAGFGEGRLMIATPDETAEPRNRRVEYTVAVEPPAGVKWQRLP